MSQDQLKQSLPFITRDMMAFEHGAAFSLRISSQATRAGTLTIRGFTREGVFTLKHSTVNDTSIQTQDYRIPDIPVWVSIQDENIDFDQGSVFATLDLLINGDRSGQLCAGLVYQQKAISWPSSNTMDMVPGMGRVQTVASADPAAGAELTISVPATGVWKVKALTFTLVAAAAAASRRVHVVFNMGSAAFNAFALVDQIISETKQYNVGHYGATPDETDDNDILINIPDNLILTAGDTIVTQTTALQAGDNFGVMQAVVESFVTPF